jgi:hypothetical protein
LYSVYDTNHVSEVFVALLEQYEKTKKCESVLVLVFIGGTSVVCVGAMHCLERLLTIMDLPTSFLRAKKHVLLQMMIGDCGVCGVKFLLIALMVGGRRARECQSISFLRAQAQHKGVKSKPFEDEAPNSLNGCERFWTLCFGVRFFTVTWASAGCAPSEPEVIAEVPLATPTMDTGSAGLVVGLDTRRTFGLWVLAKFGDRPQVGRSAFYEKMKKSMGVFTSLD